jgi:hypothetical protein
VHHRLQHSIYAQHQLQQASPSSHQAHRDFTQQQLHEGAAELAQYASRFGYVQVNNPYLTQPPPDALVIHNPHSQ